MFELDTDAEGTGGGAGTGTGACRCDVGREGGTLVVSAEECPGDGRLVTEPVCRETVVRAIDGTVERVRVVTGDTERRYDERAAALLDAARRFADRMGDVEPSLAERSRRDPLGAARAAAGRGTDTRVGRTLAESGLALCAGRVADRPEPYAAALAPEVAPRLPVATVRRRPPVDATFVDRRSLPTGAVVRRYRTGEGSLYHLEPAEYRLGPAGRAVLADARERLTDAGGHGGEWDGPGDVPGDGTPDRGVGDGAIGRAASEAVAAGEAEVEVEPGLVAAVLRRHTRGLGVVEDVLSDPSVSDVFASAPVEGTRVRVRVGGEPMPTNVRLGREGAATLVSHLRRASGRALSRATPTMDATATVADRRVRVAAVTDPVSDGPGFAFRVHDGAAWRLDALVENGTLTPAAAGLLSVAVGRGAAGLVAGPRGAGKTTLLGACCWELPPEIRTVVVEDTPELPVEALQDADRDVQALRTETGDGDGPSVDPDAALRTALRLGDGALVVGEVRGEEARTLFEAMRVGAGDGAVLGTVHGEGARAVRERVVADLGVDPTAFAATDLVATVGRADEGERRLLAVEEVGGDGTTFDPLFEQTPAGLEPTGRIDRGESRLVAALAGPTETYADVREAIEHRTTAFRGEIAETDDGDERRREERG
ncbi:MAG: ATPase, T2SS/T4P/T4SS family [Haloarculaceae archaeon]